MKTISKNQSAIQFTGTDIFDNKISLNDYKGKKVFLTFFRVAPCPYSNIAIQQLIRNHAKFEEQGIQIISLFASSKEDILQYAGKQQPPFPIIADSKFDIYKAYGIQQSYLGMLRSMINPIRVFKVMSSGFFNFKAMKEKPIIPADFLIDENQTIQRVYYGKDFGDHLSVEEILKWKE